MILPYLDGAGNVTTMKARCIKCPDACEGHKKYYAEEGTEPSLYNVAALLSDEHTLWITEGEMDCIVLSYEMGLCSVAFAGTANWRPHFDRAISPDWNRVVFLADGDEPGRLAAKKHAKALSADVLVLPDGQDVASIYAKRGRGALLTTLGLDPVDTGEPAYPDEPPY